MASGYPVTPSTGSSFSVSYSHPVTLLDSLNKRGVGFQNQFRFFEEMFNSSTASKYPPYDILSTEEDKYEIRFAAAGFSKNDIEITFENNCLVVKGEKDEEEDLNAYFHKGIANRNFTQSFPLADYVEVTGASMSDGILTITLEKVVPEDMKPKTIKIK